ncbi:MAG TPA: sulfotransferase [Gammaproteobacteria bacterium]
MPLAVIGIGYPRTATMSLKLALEQLGFGPCHAGGMRLPMIPLSAQVWGYRILFLGLGVLPSALAGSPFPALAFGLAWGPNGLFLMWLMRGALRLPRFLVAIHPVEPVLYRFLGVGLVKRIVATRIWPLMHGGEPPPKAENRRELLDRIDSTTRGAEACHGATFILASSVALLFLALGQFTEAAWIVAFNMLLNGYPVMLQRVTRRRVQQIRASACQGNPTAATNVQFSTGS